MDQVERNRKEQKKIERNRKGQKEIERNREKQKGTVGIARIKRITGKGIKTN